jgi:hypothetical protein
MRSMTGVQAADFVNRLWEKAKRKTVAAQQRRPTKEGRR